MARATPPRSPLSASPRASPRALMRQGVEDGKHMGRSDPGPRKPGDREKPRCTDVFCIFPLLILLAALGATAYYAIQEGAVARIFAGYDFHGRLCGPHLDVSGYIFWPLSEKNRSQIDFEKPICVEQCPMDNATLLVPVFNDTGVERLVDRYTTRHWVAFCMPRGTAWYAAIRYLCRRRGFVSEDLLNEIETLVQYISTYRSTARPVAVSLCIGVIVGYFSLATLRHAALLAKLCILSILACPLSTFLWYGSRYWLAHPSDWNETLGFQNGEGDLIIAILSVACFVPIFGFFRGTHHNLSTMTHMMEAAVCCITDVPSVLLEPVISLLEKFGIVAFMAITSMYVLAVGIEPRIDFDNPVENHHFSFSCLHCAVIFFWVFMTWWLLELVHSRSTLTLACVTQRWYYSSSVASDSESNRKRSVESTIYFSRHWEVWRYHLGTVALGSLMIALLRPLHWTLGPFCKGRLDDKNVLAKLVRGLPFSSCYSDRFMHMDMHVYMDVAITSDDFFHASRRAQAILTEEVPSTCFAVQHIFCILIVALISSTTFFSCWFMVEELEWFDSGAEQPPHSYEHRPSPRVAATAACLLSFFLVAGSFIVVLDVVVHTMLDCYARDMKWLKRSTRSTTKSWRDDEAWCIEPLADAFVDWFWSSDEIQEEREEMFNRLPEPLQRLAQEQDFSLIGSRISPR